jgi:polyphosphate kinase
MERNLSRRFEVGFPVYNPELKEEILEILRLQWKDNVKARIINKIQNNSYKKSVAKQKTRSQMDIYEYLSEKAEALKKASEKQKAVIKRTELQKSS